MAFPGQSIQVDEFTRAALGKMARKHGLEYGQVVELLVLEEILREAMREHSESIQVRIGDEVLARIRERLGG